MLTLSLEAHGLKEAEKMIKDALGACSIFSAADLIGTKREPYPGQSSAPTNKEIVEHLSDMGLDVIPTDDETAEKCAKAFAEEVEKRIAYVKGNEGQGRSSEIGAAAWRAAMKALRLAAVERIEHNAIGSVSEEWAEKRSNTFGVPDDTSNVGRASGQLLSDLNPSGSKATVKVRKA